MDLTSPMGGEPMNMARFIGLILRGIAIGAANVIPGVSGGTVALISGIYPELINAIKSFGWKPLKLIFKGQLRKSFNETNGPFICAVGIGVLISVFTLAKALEHLLLNHLTLTMAFFFGLILASIFLVATRIPKWNIISILAVIVGICIAGTILLIKPLGENPHPAYVFLCGVVAICSMILPGISGSFILILMGNYALVLSAASNVRDLSTSLPILLPFIGGCAVGILGFSRILSVVLEKFKSMTMALLTGFIIGSLAVIWPWKEEIRSMFGEKEKVTGYQWYLPPPDNMLLLALLLMLSGAGLVLILERFAGNSPKEPNTE
jgi:putative membrane protein